MEKLIDVAADIESRLGESEVPECPTMSHRGDESLAQIAERICWDFRF